MGSGSWNTSTFANYVTSTSLSRGYTATVDSLGTISTMASNQDMFKAVKVDEALNPYKIMRECKDSEEHPNTLPIILALDVTGSLGQAAVEIAKKLNVIMTSLYDKVKDVEFMIMGIGDLYCDIGPIQISQFESDVRIAEQLDKLWFEFGGGGNFWESYTVAWYMGSRHCKLDCWNRGKKGIIITIGDERLNPILQHEKLSALTGDTLQADIVTKDLYNEVTEKYNVYHIHVDHDNRVWDKENIDKSWEILGNNYKKANMNNVADVIVDIIVNNDDKETTSTSNDGISW